jgi:hypothetical protein
MPQLLPAETTATLSLETAAPVSAPLNVVVSFLVSFGNASFRLALVALVDGLVPGLPPPFVEIAVDELLEWTDRLFQAYLERTDV